MSYASVVAVPSPAPVAYVWSDVVWPPAPVKRSRRAWRRWRGRSKDALARYERGRWSDTNPRHWLPAGT